jgi:hypothetical protein
MRSWLSVTASNLGNLWRRLTQAAPLATGDGGHDFPRSRFPLQGSNPTYLLLCNSVKPD